MKLQFKLDSWPFLAAGAVLVGVVSCFSATNATDKPSVTTEWTDTMVANSALSSSVSSTEPSDTYAPYYTPFSFQAILGDSYTLPSLTTASSVTSRSRYLLSVDSNTYLTIGTPSSTVATAFTADTAPTTYAAILADTFQAVGDSAVTNGFRLDSELHSLYSLDVGSDGTTLVFHNNWGKASAPTGRGYLVLTYDGTNHWLQAQARYSYDEAAYTHAVDGTFAKDGWYVNITGSSASLVESSGEATAITLSNAPIDVAIPANFNPDSIVYQTNDRVPIGTGTVLNNKITDMEGNTGGHVLQNLDSAYSAQVAATGDDSGTETAALAELTAIETDSTLRYPKDLYMAFRKGLLNTYLKSDGIANGTLGMHAVPYVFFTNASEGGVHHPFMVIAAYSITDKPNRLLDVRRPPGDGSAPGYAQQKVTRDATLQLYLYKIPLKNYGEVSALTDNTMAATLKSDAASSDADSVYNYASISAVGVAVDGTAIYPVLNNTLVPAQNNAELTSIGDHVGQGMGLHYHADGHIAMNNDLQLYNINDYKDQEHPPLIGFGLDGVALFGVYESEYPDMEGKTTALDSFGGHSHGDYGYHYHAHIVTAQSSNGNSYQLDVLLKGAWKGNINSIPDFWDEDDTKPSYNEPSYALSQNSIWVGKAP